MKGQIHIKKIYPLQYLARSRNRLSKLSIINHLVAVVNILSFQVGRRFLPFVTITVRNFLGYCRL